MRLNSSYPVLLSDDVRASAAFYVDHLGFVPVYDSHWYVSLRHGGTPRYELAFVQRDHETIPAAFRHSPRGVLLNFEVADAAAEWERLREIGAPVLLALRDEPFGQRHFILEGPGREMIDVIEIIATSPEFAAGFVAGSD